MLLARPGRSGKQEQEQNSPNLRPAFKPSPVGLLVFFATTFFASSDLYLYLWSYSGGGSGYAYTCLSFQIRNRGEKSFFQHAQL